MTVNLCKHVYILSIRYNEVMREYNVCGKDHSPLHTNMNSSSLSYGKIIFSLYAKILKFLQSCEFYILVF